MRYERRRKGAGPTTRSTSFSTRSPPAGEDYRRLVERLPAIVYAAEMGEHGRWRYVSPQVEEILGYTPEEWIADPELWASLLHPEDRERALEQETAETLGDRNPPPVDYRMMTRDGEVVWILDEAVLEPDDDGRPGLARRPLRHHRAQAAPSRSCSGRAAQQARSPGSASGRCRTATPRR